MITLILTFMSEPDEVSNKRRERKVVRYRYHPVTIMAIDERLTALEADVTKLEDRVARLEAPCPCLCLNPLSHEKSML